MKVKRLAALLLVVAMLFTFVSVIAACDKHELTSIEVTPNSVTLQVGQKSAKPTITFTPDDADKEVTWASANTAVATVDGEGIITAVAAGSTKVTVTSKSASDVKAEIQVTGTEPVAPHVCGHVCPECGKCLDATCTDPVCADKCQGHDVDPDKGKTQNNPLTPEEAISLMKKAGSGIVVGAAEKQQYYVQGVVNTGSTVDTQYHEWSFTLGTGSEKVTCQATVDNGVSKKPTETNGALDGATVIIHGFLELYQGAYKIAYLPPSASPTGAKFTPVLVDIVIPVGEVASITLDHTEDMVLLANHPNKYMDLEATVLPANAPQDVTWSVSENTANITVSSSGRISWTETEGEATITATAKDTNKSASVKVQVQDVKGSTVEDPISVDEAIALLTDDGVEVFAGYAANNTQGFYLTGKAENSVFHSQTVNSYWTFDLVGSNGTLSCTTTGSFSGVGAVTDGALDDYTVVLRNVLLKKVSDEYTSYNAIPVSATRPALTGITIDSAAEVTFPAFITLTATPVPANASLDGIEWHSSEEGKATVDDNGKVTGVAAGTTEITATVGSITSNVCTVTVNATAESGIATYDWTGNVGTAALSSNSLTLSVTDWLAKLNQYTEGQTEITAATATGRIMRATTGWKGLGYYGGSTSESTVSLTTLHNIKKITFKILPYKNKSKLQFSVNGQEFSKQKGDDETWNGTVAGGLIDAEFTLSEASNSITMTIPASVCDGFAIVGMVLEY